MVYDFFVNRIIKGIWHQLKWGVYSFTDPIFYLFLSLGFVGLYVPSPDLRLPLALLLGKAFIEELFFRFLLQEGLDRFFHYGYRFGPLSLANILASLTFSCMHLINQPLNWAMLTFIPSLAFGFIWQRYRSVVPGTIIHFAYNAFLFYQFM
ncbi:JDVT-CTERM system glutamic-type intramembrane protease [Maridesulfovibrio ferrireducens]|uniref:JDVT-CTERM system glutamic-type intramembrane protease MrtJ n=1 Tax=Maridesulfovibrio ferrireducens TaxID=246191 RepID=UPI001A2EBAF4|nr:JDVT-CTERM system glutamic-type intramembrane protease [Maridesulfovibrio ferrireducens]MBI9112714.1 JDVT-CTERM system CAAX-type protease [Maridesulfovibrio ferrireducens]